MTDFALRKRKFWTCVGAEFLATTIFVFAVSSSTLSVQGDATVVVLHVSLTAGLTVATLVMATGHLTGGLINPALTTALMATKKISVLEGVFYIVAQFLGAILGAALLYGLTPGKMRGVLGATTISSDLSASQAFGLELLLTFVLVFTIFAATDPGREFRGYDIPLSIGVCVFICHMCGIPLTGCSMNPARSLGPALIRNFWKDHWVYWVGPVPGGIIAAFLYEYVFSTRSAGVSPA